jgi:hypothetical protein
MLNRTSNFDTVEGPKQWKMDITWNLEGEKSLLVRVTKDSCRTVSHILSGSTGGQLGEERH